MSILTLVIMKDNYKEIPKLADLLMKLKVTQFQFVFVHILGSADKNKEIIVPRKTDIIPYVHKALDLAKKNNVPAFTEAILDCLMQGYEWAIAENVMSETSVIDAEYKIDSYADYRWSEGPWREYPKMYGWGEFIAIN